MDYCLERIQIMRPHAVKLKSSERKIPRKLVSDYLSRTQKKARELATDLGAHPTTVQRMIDVEGKQTPTGPLVAALGLLMAAAGIPLLPSQFVEGYDLFKTMKNAIDEADPGNKAFRLLRLIDEIDGLVAREQEAKQLYEWHKKSRTVKKDGLDNPRSRHLISLLELLDLHEDMERAEKGLPIQSELRFMVIQDHFAGKRKELYRQFEQLEQELEQEAEQYASRLADSPRRKRKYRRRSQD